MLTDDKLRPPPPASACLHGCPTRHTGNVLGCASHPALCEHGGVYRVCRLPHVVGPAGSATP